MTGRIAQISGSVIDVQFEQGQLPAIKEALKVKIDDETRVMEVAQHIGHDMVRCIMLASSDGMSKGMEVERTMGSIRVPVGTSVLGRMFNVLGDPIAEESRYRLKSLIGRSTEKRPPSASSLLQLRSWKQASRS